jgi:hypothetical protein
VLQAPDHNHMSQDKWANKGTITKTTPQKSNPKFKFNTLQVGQNNGGQSNILNRSLDLTSQLNRQQAGSRLNFATQN